MELRQLEYLARIATLGTFTRAAASLGLSEPTLSEQMKSLEREIGVAVFDRSRRPIRLTPVGEALLRHAHQIFSELAQFREELRELAGAQSGQVVIGSVSSAAPLIPHLLAAFAERFPRIRVSVREELQRDLIRLLKNGELDACVILTQAEGLLGQEFPSVRLFSFEMAFVVRPEHPLAGRRDVSVRELENERFVLALSTDAGPVRQSLTRFGLKPQIAFQSNKPAMILALVANGAGVGLAPEFLVQSARPELKTFRLAEPLPSYEAYLFWSLSSRNKDHVAALVDFVTSNSEVLSPAGLGLVANGSGQPHAREAVSIGVSDPDVPFVH